MYAEFTRKRISDLCFARGLSERKVSLDLGHSNSYIRSITSGRALPSMGEFFYLCEYFSITPREFFDDGEADPAFLREIIEDMKHLDAKQLEHLSALIKTMR